MPSPTKAIVVTGTPAVGKTAVSRLLAKTLGGVHIDLGREARRRGLTLGLDKRRRTLIADTKKLRDLVEDHFGKGIAPVIVNGHLAPDVVPRRVLKTAFVLRCSPDKLMLRMKRRRYGAEKIRENLAAEALDVCLFEAISVYGREKVHEIDCTHMTPEETVGEMLGVLEGHMKPIVGRVDWLAELDRQGRTSLLE